MPKLILYQVLDVQEDATIGQIEQAYRTRSLQFLTTLLGNNYDYFYSVSDAFQILRKHREFYETSGDSPEFFARVGPELQDAVDFFVQCFGVPQLEIFTGPVPILYWIQELRRSFPFTDTYNHITTEGITDKTMELMRRNAWQGNETLQKEKNRSHEFDITGAINVQDAAQLIVQQLLDVDLEGDDNIKLQKAGKLEQETGVFPTEGFSPQFTDSIVKKLKPYFRIPFAVDVLKALGTIFMVRAEGYAAKYRGKLFSSVVSNKSANNASSLIEKIVWSKNRLHAISKYFKQIGGSIDDQVNIIYTEFFYQLVREVCLAANLTVSEIFEGEWAAKEDKKDKMVRAYRIWEIGNFLCIEATRTAAERGISIEHNPNLQHDDVLAGAIYLTAFNEALVLAKKRNLSNIDYSNGKAAAPFPQGASFDPWAVGVVWSPWDVVSDCSGSGGVVTTEDVFTGDEDKRYDVEVTAQGGTDAG
ncbi:hypothetical protein B0I72DRAFT_142047 [Yarrowia lipolytica]|jgi:hypothetical protein|uniref:YALI0D24541p n=2 Tax=Yarrowia lipolytica TaxID=4952 RepID=Q6C7X6_YARLI|nr:YALI0D24541p [Yarrowia lipolytica CLIB122]AOW04588.1 hypothetical protein YALI1_D32468g [Yarrowia lipolytica]KAB8280238.1 hypothetical protein BKA91DRAFT_142281 [Yarrowia lipolytica]KAE8169275.1 hypothetical protein BKA90DRAFT_142935 [Yarrowia lipolytica]KAJ8053973.1 hypothetical protein LXG23DRAFT_21844 [Yarrowia lipolytica]QNP98081.1 Hypothetical protein YALI2_D00522g [Yarrowia lipolytica]|eukprot:XP_503236.1 YALI0D24541p [Yarrowia lipolytica CLIB122]